MLQIDRSINVIVREKPFGTHYRIKAYPLDPRQQFAFVTDLTVRGKAALRDAGMALASVPAIAEQSP